MLNLLAGADPMDPTSRSGETPDYTQALEAGVQGWLSAYCGVSGRRCRSSDRGSRDSGGSSV